MMISHVSEIMGRRRMNVANLSRSAGISRVTASKLYNGGTDVNLSVLDKVCKALDADLCELIEYVPDERSEQDQKDNHRLTATGAQK